MKFEIVFESSKSEKVGNTKLNDTNLISAINVKVIPAVAYLMKV